MTNHESLVPYTRRGAKSSWGVRMLYVAGMVVTLPAVAATRLWPGRWRQRHDESVFRETNRAVLTALGLAFSP